MGGPSLSLCDVLSHVCYKAQLEDSLSLSVCVCVCVRARVLGVGIAVNMCGVKLSAYRIPHLGGEQSNISAQYNNPPPP